MRRRWIARGSIVSFGEDEALLGLEFAKTVQCKLVEELNSS